VHLTVGIRHPKGATITPIRTPKNHYFRECEKAVVEPKKEHTEHEENGVRKTRETYDNPETNTHIEEVKIERIQDDQRKEK
jgi:hypothetical protein